MIMLFRTYHNSIVTKNLKSPWRLLILKINVNDCQRQTSVFTKFDREPGECLDFKEVPNFKVKKKMAASSKGTF